MRLRILGACACAFALISAPGLAAERSVGDGRPARTYIEVVTIDPLTGAPSAGGGGGGGGGTSGSANGFVALPACTGTPLTTPTKGVVVSSAGNLGLRLSDGTNNDSQVIPVVAGQVFPFRAVCRSAANTAGVLGLN